MAGLNVENNIPETVPSRPSIQGSVSNSQCHVELARYHGNRAIIVDSNRSLHAKILDTVTEIPEKAAWVSNRSTCGGTCRTIKTVRVSSARKTSYGHA